MSRREGRREISSFWERVGSDFLPGGEGDDEDDDEEELRRVCS